MLIVRNIFVAKPGSASKLAKQIKESLEAGGVQNTRVLTDLTGEFNRVILEMQVANMVEFESSMQAYGTNQAMREKLAGSTDLWTTGTREILKVM